MAEKFMFHSVLAPYIQRLVEAKESAGLSALRLKWILKEFDDFAAGIGLTDPHITSGLIEQWRKTRIADADSTLYSKYSAWAQLTRMMSRNGVACYVPGFQKSLSRTLSHISSPTNRYPVFLKRPTSGACTTSEWAQRLYQCQC